MGGPLLPRAPLGRSRPTDLDISRQRATALDHGVVIDDAVVFNDKLTEWEDFDNVHRPHGGLDGRSPYERRHHKTTTARMKQALVSCPLVDANQRNGQATGGVTSSARIECSAAVSSSCANAPVDLQPTIPSGLISAAPSRVMP
jgi:hypothetical protein